MKNWLTLFFVLWIGSCYSQTDSQESPIIFIYDASGSMWGQMEGRTKMEIAREVLSSSIESLPVNQQIGLIAYGHRMKSDCEDVQFLADSHNTDKEILYKALQGIKPLGKTPLAYSASTAIDQLRRANIRATIILVTDGIESCGGNLCEVVGKAREAGVTFKLHIIGFGLKGSETEELKCATGAGDGGYFDAQNASGLESVLQEATRTTIDMPDANTTFYALKNGKSIDAYIRAFTAGNRSDAASTRTYADTGRLYLPAGHYDFEINPLEGSDVQAVVLRNISVFEDQVVHHDVQFDAGVFEISVSNNGQGWDAVVKIFPAGSPSPVAAGRTYGKSESYELNPGIYDIEITPLVMKGADVRHKMVNQAIVSNQTVQISHDYRTGIARFGARSSNGLVDATINIVEVNSNKSVANSRTYTSDTTNPKEFILQPGVYEVTMTALGAHKGQREKFTVTVEAGKEFVKVVDF